jgi:hypothetical protein
MTALRELCQQEKEEAQRMKLEADKVKIKEEWRQIRMAILVCLSKSLNLICAKWILAMFGTNKMQMKAIPKCNFLFPGIINIWQVR